ncbi:MAG: amidohydrolase family protein, partial [Microvirga sp.]
MASDLANDYAEPTRRAVTAGLLAAAAGAPFAALAQSGAPTDCHAHIFKRGLKLADVRRYAPDYDATVADYLRVLDENGMARGVLVQPSFLGTDNGFLLEGLSAAPTRLRGIAVVEPTATKEELAELDRKGVVGIRLNLVGLPIPRFDEAPWPALLKSVAGFGWQVEVHREAKDLEPIVAPLLRAGVTVVVDHFGRPDARLGVESGLPLSPDRGRAAAHLRQGVGGLPQRQGRRRRGERAQGLSAAARRARPRPA